MKVGIATDHNGVIEKRELVEYLTKKGFEIVDYSTDNNPTDDYPDFALRVANGVKDGNVDMGILMCGTGIGMSIAANKVEGIRCAKVSTESEAVLAREHNNANIIALSYKLPMMDLQSLCKNFLTTDFSNDERHVRRVNKISDIEAK